MLMVGRPELYVFIQYIDQWRRVADFIRFLIQKLNKSKYNIYFIHRQRYMEIQLSLLSENTTEVFYKYRIIRTIIFTHVVNT